MNVSLPVLRALAGISMLAAVTAGEQAAAQSQKCLDMTCFRDHQVRDFRALDDDTIIIYVGPERCPFLIELRGAYCDAKFLPDIDFFHERERRMNNRANRAGGTAVDENIRRRTFGDRNGAIGALGRDRNDGFTRNDRICLNNAGQYALETFGFSPYFQGELPQDLAECPVVSVAKITDDDLIEIYTEDGVPPPPPIGNGSISRGSASESGGE